jgi:hypothetical protein
MARANLSLPHERRKAKLKSRQLQLKVRQAETREQLKATNAELAAMRPAPKPTGGI